MGGGSDFGSKGLLTKLLSKSPREDLFPFPTAILLYEEQWAILYQIAPISDQIVKNGQKTGLA